MPEYEKKAVKIVFFRGGPLDGKAYNTVDLLDPVSAADLPTHEYRWTQEKITSKLTSQTARVWEWRGAEAVAALAITDKERGKMQNTTTDGVTPDKLLERRKALGLSRTIVSEKAGVTPSQLGSMEMSGKRIKPGVMDKVADALAHFEREQGVASESSDKEDHTVPQ